MHGYSRPVRCSLLAIPTVLNLFIFPPHIYVRVTFRLLLLYLSRMPIKLLKKKKKKKNLHPSISFTMELPTENTLPFLGMVLRKDSQNITTSVYVKPTNTGLLLQTSTYAQSSFLEKLDKISNIKKSSPR